MISLEGFPLSIGVKIWQPWVSGSKCSLKAPVAYARYLPVTGDHLMVLLRYLRFLSKSAGTWQVPLDHFQSPAGTWHSQQVLSDYILSH